MHARARPHLRRSTCSGDARDSSAPLLIGRARPANTPAHTRRRPLVPGRMLPVRPPGELGKKLMATRGGAHRPAQFIFIQFPSGSMGEIKIAPAASGPAPTGTGNQKANSPRAARAPKFKLRVTRELIRPTGRHWDAGSVSKLPLAIRGAKSKIQVSRDVVPIRAARLASSDSQAEGIKS